MKFKSALVTQVSGSVGGMTGAHNQGGLYFRGRSIPVNPNTSFQQVVRNAVSQLSTRFSQTLTAAQRAAWAVYAANVPLVDRLGDSRNVTSIAQYVRSNTPILQSGGTVVDDGPTTFALPTFSDPSFTVDATADEVDVGFTDTDAWANEAGGYMLVYASRPQSASIGYFKGPYRYAGKVTGAATPPTSPETIALPFPVAAGHQVFFKVSVVRADGRLSSPFRGVAVAA